MSTTRRAVWNIERNLDRPLTLATIAAGIGVSPFHLAHAFGRTTGLSALRYARERRLSEAAKLLARGDASVTETAYAAGYATHAAFTRAFARHFGRPPSAVGRERSTAGLVLRAPMKVPPAKASRALALRRVASPRMFLVGTTARYAYEDVAGIPRHWARFMGEASAIAHRTATSPLSVSTRAGSDGFDYTCAWEVSRLPAAAGRWTLTTLPARSYAVFRHDRHVSSLPEAYAWIWDEGLRRLRLPVADAPTLERFDPRFDPVTGMGGIEIWIPLR